METKSENILRTDYAEVMQKSYIDYAMSVIVARALPDVRDGLKPVQRRTLYDMYELGIRPDRPYRKCARIVGDTMGKYHPHGDSSIYEALVVMAQDFKKGKTLVDGHGNFGSIEGDGAAAMRYTEARLEKLTWEVFLGDLDKDVVDFVPNFDETEKEPSVLPVKIPNLLVNGSEGIAVGMATSIPTHNLGEVVDAVKAFIKNKDITTKGLMKYIKGPDFPTGGIVVNQDELPSIYETGVGKIRIRGRVQEETLKGGKKLLVITEIPYTMLGANIAKFLNDVAALVETRKTTDILDISNQSSKEGIRIVLELRKDADVTGLTNLLYKKTRLEDTFGVNMLAVADGKPETLSLKGIIEHHVDFLFDFTTRKYQIMLSREKEKEEIQEGLIRAVDVIDLIIEVLRGSKSREMAKQCLMTGETEGITFKTKASEKLAKKLSFTEKQATAIMEMRLYRLIGLELDALIAEHDQTLANIALYQHILDDYDAMADVLIRELNAIKREYATPRKTGIENAEEIVLEEKPEEEMDVCFLMDRFGYVKVVDKAGFERNEPALRQESRYVYVLKNTDRIGVFTEAGQLHIVKIKDIPLVKPREKGIPVDNCSNYDSAKERILFVAPMSQILTGTLLFVTASSMCKQVTGDQFEAGRRTIAATKLAEGDKLIFVGFCDDMEQVVLRSHKGFFLRFAIGDVSLLKKVSVGVRGMKLSEGDEVEDAYVMDLATTLSVPAGGGEVSLNKLKIAGRGTKGTKVRPS